MTFVRPLVLAVQRRLSPSKDNPSSLPLAQDVLPFQSDLQQIIAEAPTGLLGASQYLVAGLFLGLLAVASLTEVDVVVTGRGRLAADKPPIVIQPLERAIVRDILVKSGDAVARGQVLVTLDPTFAEADRSSLLVQQRSLQAQVARLGSELSGPPLVVSETLDLEQKLQFDLYRQRQAQLASQLMAFDEDILRAEANIRRLEDALAALQDQGGLTAEIEQIRLSLMKSEWGSKLQYLDAKFTRLKIERERIDTANQLAEQRHYLSSRRADRQAFQDGWQRQILEELAKARQDLQRIEDSLTKADRINDMVVLRAPEDGVVLDVAKRSVGSVMREAEPLVTLVPSTAELIADVTLSSGEIGYTKTGDAVVVKIDAFPYQRHGALEGRLRSVSQESVSGQSLGQAGDAFHRGQISLTETSLDYLPEGARIIPGMTLTAEIKVGTRSLISYFLYPITRGFEESLREP